MAGMFGSGDPNANTNWQDVLGRLFAGLQDASAAYQGRPGDALKSYYANQKRLGDQKKYEDTIGGLFGAQNINNVQSTAQMPMQGAGAELANRQASGAYDAPVYGGAIGGLPGSTQQMLQAVLPTMDPIAGYSTFMNAIQDSQQRTDRKNERTQDMGYQDRVRAEQRAQTVADNTIRQATLEEKARFNYSPETPVFMDGFGKPTVVDDPNKMTPLQREQLRIQREQLGIQRQQANRPVEYQPGTVLYDPKTLKPLGQTPLSPKQQQEAQDRIAQQRGAAEGYDAAIGTLENLMTMGGLESAVGMKNVFTNIPFVGAIPGTPQADFEAKLNTLKSQTFLPMVQQLKGMGALSNTEGETLTSAIGALDTSQSEKAFKESAADIWRRLTEARNRVPGIAPRKFGNKAPWEAQSGPTVSNW